MAIPIHAYFAKSSPGQGRFGTGDRRDGVMKKVLVGAVFGSLASYAAQAGPIDRACVATNRAANPLICACIQRVANVTLTGADQRLAAQLVRDPSKVQEVRQSGQPKHRAFWERYTAFGDAAVRACSD